MTDRSLREVARAAAAVAAASPDDLLDFDDAARAFVASPAAARRALRGRSEPTASGYATATEFAATLALAVGTDLCKDALIAGGKKGVSALRARLHRSAVDLDAEVPPIEEGQAAELTERATEIARQLGVPAEPAARIAAALARVWPRRR
jgi:hypothetical protein